MLVYTHKLGFEFIDWQVIRVRIIDKGYQE